MNRFLLGILAIPALFLANTHLHAQVSTETAMDWSTGIFRISAMEPLPENLSPNDHPQALAMLEDRLPQIAAEELGALNWNRHGSLEEYIRNNAAAPGRFEFLTRSIRREWSRITPDGLFVEALYSLDLSMALPSAFPPSRVRDTPPIPPGWHPRPEDPWSGIVVYAPSMLPLRGRESSAEPMPALRARILAADLTVLFDPETSAGQLPYYGILGDETERITGRRPMRLLADELYGSVSCDIILTLEDSERILSSPSARQVLTEGRVMILLDAFP